MLELIDRLLVFYNDQHVGYLDKLKTQDSPSLIFRFQYLPKYLSQTNPSAIAYKFPLQQTPFLAKTMFPFFQGLVSEGWNLKRQSKLQKIDEMDYFNLLRNNGVDMIGAVSIRVEDDTNDN